MTEMSGTPMEQSHDTRPVVVVPCFNEARRLDEGAFRDLAQTRRVRLLFVDDGSTDGTGAILERLQQSNESIDVLGLPRNVGKAEAVRHGLRRAIGMGAAIVGYFDADLATPGTELLRMVDILESRVDLMAVFGSRVVRLGSHIERRPFRHYTGRVFATAASVALGVAVYDTQCGAKVFRVDATFKAAIEEPFRSAWSFDVLLCQRLLDGTSDLPGLPIDSFLEMPLDIWRDVGGSNVTLWGSARALWDLLVLGMARRWRERSRPH
jgi:glycosyltransferase involved in cell wall biosynthesis